MRVWRIATLIGMVAVSGAVRAADGPYPKGLPRTPDAFPLAVWLITKPSWPVVAAAIIGCAFIIYKHSSNIARLRAGTENVFSFGATRR